MAACCADAMIGGAGSDRSKPAWRQVFRTLEHSHANSQCKDRQMIEKFPIPIQEFAITFAAMQIRRHDADYDPYEKFLKSSVKSDIAAARSVIEKFFSAPMKDRRAFAAWVLLRQRRR